MSFLAASRTVRRKNSASGGTSRKSSPSDTDTTERGVNRFSRVSKGLISGNLASSTGGSLFNIPIGWKAAIGRTSAGGQISYFSSVLANKESLVVNRKKQMKFERNLSSVVTKRISQIKERVTNFSNTPVALTASIRPDHELAEQFTVPTMQHTETQHTADMSVHEVNTDTMEFTCSGVRHVEGGWPKDVNFMESDQTLRYKKKIEKDEFYIHAVLQLGSKMEHCIRQNNAVDIYEIYWREDELHGAVSPLLLQEEVIKTLDVMRDPQQIAKDENASEADMRNGGIEINNLKTSQDSTTSGMHSPSLSATENEESEICEDSIKDDENLKDDENIKNTENFKEDENLKNDENFNDAENLKDAENERDTEYLKDTEGFRDTESFRDSDSLSEHLEDISVSEVCRDRAITSIDFAPGTRAVKFVAGYSSSVFKCPGVNTPRTAYVWDISSTSRIDMALESPSWLHSVRYNPKEPFIIGAGLHNGQCGWWDVRKGGQAATVSPLDGSHSQVVTGLEWIPSKTKCEIITTSTDGKVSWWDMRSMDCPVESVPLLLNPDTENGNDEQNLTEARQMTASCMARVVGATAKVLIGSEQGTVLAVNRRARNACDKIGAPYRAHSAPVYSIQRNPGFPKHFLTIGDWTVKVWSEDFHHSAILHTPPSSSKLSCASWSPTRSSVFISGRMDGYLNIWDIMTSWSTPYATFQVFDCGLQSIDIHDGGRLVALGSEGGSLSIIKLPTTLAEPLDKSDKSCFTSILEREARRERFLQLREKELKLKKKVRHPGKKKSMKN